MSVHDKIRTYFWHNSRQLCIINCISDVWTLAMNDPIEYKREEDGRWIEEAPRLPGVLAYGTTADDAMKEAEALALCVPVE